MEANNTNTGVIGCERAESDVMPCTLYFILPHTESFGSLKFQNIAGSLVFKVEFPPPNEVASILASP